MQEKQSAPILTLLKTHFGYDTLRPNQQEFITSLCQGEDALVIMPTGGRKACNELKREMRQIKKLFLDILFGLRTFVICKFY